MCWEKSRILCTLLFYVTNMDVVSEIAHSFILFFVDL